MNTIVATCSDGVVSVTGTGVLTAPVGTQMMCAAVACAREHGSELYIFDFRAMDFREPLSSLYRRPQIADEVGIPRSARIATLVDKIDATFQFVEDVAVNRGVVLQIFTDEAAALAWLKNTAVAADPSAPNKNRSTDPTPRR